MDSHIILRTSSSDISEEGGRKRSVSSPDTASNLIRKKQNIQNIGLNHLSLFNNTIINKF